MKPFKPSGEPFKPSVEPFKPSVEPFKMFENIQERIFTKETMYIYDWKLPIYVSNSNIIIPWNIPKNTMRLAFDKIYDLYTNLNFIFIKFVDNIVITFASYNPSTLWKIIIIISIYTIFTMGIIDVNIKKINKHNQDIKILQASIETLEKKLNNKDDLTKEVEYLKKLENLRESLEQIWKEEMLDHYNKSQKKIGEIKQDITVLEARQLLLEKKNKKLEKEIKNL